MSWQLVTTVPNAESKVSRMLERLSFDHRLYRLRRKVAFRGRVVDQLCPLFPRYIFVRALRCWDAVREITGVVDFVRFGGVIVDVAEREVAKLASMSDADNIVTSELYSNFGKFRCGEKVRVAGMTSLVFGLNGIYQHPVGADKAYVLLPWFNGQLTGTVVDEMDLVSVDVRSRRRSSKRRRMRYHTQLSS